ncbi:MAG: hypothetical protein Q8Q20_05575 [bacterium]|nr:hypothetical protein [bacterium]
MSKFLKWVGMLSGIAAADYFESRAEDGKSVLAVLGALGCAIALDAESTQEQKDEEEESDESSEEPYKTHEPRQDVVSEPVEVTPTYVCEKCDEVVTDIVAWGMCGRCYEKWDADQDYD